MKALRVKKKEEQEAKRFAKMDANGDGSVTRDEMNAVKEQRKAEMEARREAGEPVYGPGFGDGSGHGMGQHQCKACVWLEEDDKAQAQEETQGSVE